MALQVDHCRTVVEGIVALAILALALTLKLNRIDGMSNWYILAVVCGYFGNGFLRSIRIINDLKTLNATLQSLIPSDPAVSEQSEIQE